MEMPENPITKLTRQLIEYFSIYTKGGNMPDFQRYGELIRYQTDDLLVSGDMSIAASRINWLCFAKKNDLQLRSEAEQMLPDEQAQKAFLEHTKQWMFPLQSVSKLRKERYALRFHRRPIIEYVLETILKQGQNYGRYKTENVNGGVNVDRMLPTLCLTLHEQFAEHDVGNAKELHKFRARQLCLIVRRILDYGKWRLVEPEEQTDDTVCVSVECNNQSRRVLLDNIELKKNVRLVCGPVLEPTTKTATQLTSGSYMALRSNDMLLIAMHRHGVRDCAKGTDLEGLMQRLGHAAVIVDLFEVRHVSSTTVVRNGLGSSKGANYILYNSARLETLLRSFAEQVDTGMYDPLPPLDTIDFSLLEDEIDWQLIYGYLLTFPEVVKSTLVQLQDGVCALHLLVRYIVDLASLFSRYYRNKQILVQKRLNLMPVLYARIYLVKAVREVLNASLALLGIQPVDYM